MRLFFLFLIISVGFLPSSLFAQEFQRKKDSTDLEAEKKIEEIKRKSDQKKTSRFLSKVLIRTPNENVLANPDFEKHRNLSKNQGKVIRNIKITVLNPFGYSVSDTTVKPEKWVDKTGNRLHVKSNKLAIRNYLLFRKNQTLDSISVMDSERILREQSFIRRVHIEVDSITSTIDSVDVKVRVLDSWSTFLIPSVSSNGYRGMLRERNFMGMGHTYDNKVLYRTEDGKTTYSGNYIVPNIYKTHISTNIRYSKDLYDNHYKKLAFNRPFYSARAKWAGGMEWSELYFQDSLPNAQDIYDSQPVKYFKQSYWGGYSFPLMKDPENKEVFYRLISSVGYEVMNFAEAPSVEFDSIAYYSNEQHLLFKFALSSNRYIQDKYIFRHNEVEDIPVGRMYAITGGVRRKRHHNQMYLGLQYSFGNYYKIGYLAGDLNLGSYFDKGELNQAALNLKINYFTPVIDKGSWRIRQFISYNLKYGINRDPISVDQLHLLRQDGLPGYDDLVYGNKKSILTLQTQTYAPWSWLGFRFNPYLNLAFGVIAEKGKSLYNSSLHSRIGLGVLITNDYFVIDRIQLSISYHPHIPGSGSNLFDFNSLRNDDIYLTNFNSGRPEVVPYTTPRESKYP